MSENIQSELPNVGVPDPYRRDFAVVIPAYNEVAGCPRRSIRELRETFQRHHLVGEVLFVDDGSVRWDRQNSREAESLRTGPEFQSVEASCQPRARQRRSLAQPLGRPIGPF